MALPFILSLLGSTAAGANLLGTMSPLIAGALGSGIGSAVETGSLEEGIKTGLTSGLLGGLGGMLMGGSAGAQAAAQGGTGAASAAPHLSQAQNAAMAAQSAAPAATQPGLLGMFQNMPSGFQPGQIPGITGATFAERMGQIGSGAGQVPLGQVLQSGLQQGAMTGAGMGTALGGAMMSQPPQMDLGQDSYERPGIDPSTRRQSYTPEEGYLPGTSPEFLYFDPWVPNVNRMAEGGIAEMAPQGQPQMNDKQLVQGAIRAVQGQLPEAEAAVVLGQFLQKFGEAALRQLVDDVESGRAAGPRGDVEGMVQGPGDGMDDMVPATMDDGSQDVLLSDGEFVVPADVVSGLGNGSTDAGADELHKMMDRVRQERTGMREQPKMVAAGGLMPA